MNCFNLVKVFTYMYNTRKKNPVGLVLEFEMCRLKAVADLIY